MLYLILLPCTWSFLWLSDEAYAVVKVLQLGLGCVSFHPHVNASLYVGIVKHYETGLLMNQCLFRLVFERHTRTAFLARDELLMYLISLI